MPLISTFPSAGRPSVTLPDGLPGLSREGGLNGYSWQEIANISAAGYGELYFTEGDVHSVTLNGTVGQVTFSKTELNVFILGFDHNKDIEGAGITFGCFKNPETGKTACLTDTEYYEGNGTTDGTKCFNMSHWGNVNYGGWAGCDLRYDILGSTKTPPDGYGSKAVAGRVGYDAPTNTATSPVDGTLMKCFPAALRKLMKPITKYTDNVGGGKNDAANVTAIVDYLPLLSEFEVHGSRSYANSYEQNYQKQYSYFAAGNSKVYYEFTTLENENYDPSFGGYWWVRSPYYYNSYYFCGVSGNGIPDYNYARCSIALAPAFKI